MRSAKEHTKVRSSKEQTKLNELTKQFVAAAKIAVREAIAMHHAVGDPVTISRDGKLVHLMPDGSVQPVKKSRRKTRAA